MDMLKINDVVLKSSAMELYTLVFLSIITICLIIFIASIAGQFIFSLIKKFNISTDFNQSNSDLFKSFILILGTILIISLLVTISYLIAKKISGKKIKKK